jgi:hypothetical protein
LITVANGQETPSEIMELMHFKKDLYTDESLPEDTKQKNVELLNKMINETFLDQIKL